MVYGGRHLLRKMRSTSLLRCEESVLGSVRPFRLLHMQTSPIGADGLHPLLDDAARTSRVETKRSRSPFRATLTCGADGCATCVNFGEEERNAKIPWQREQRDRWFKPDEDRSGNELRGRSIDGRTSGGDATGGCARAKNIFRDVIDGSSIFQSSSNQCQQF